MGDETLLSVRGAIEGACRSPVTRPNRVPRGRSVVRDFNTEGTGEPRGSTEKNEIALRAKRLGLREYTAALPSAIPKTSVDFRGSPAPSVLKFDRWDGEGGCHRPPRAERSFHD
jgi:hypothetical protein